uniref:V-SNARE coiled-coil homology domain-containing protein n=1 Tax=Salarias fasciatus TaxID=181472 RepID=A0A672I5E0_SALFA
MAMSFSSEQPNAATASPSRLDGVQGQVNEVKVILKDNINKVLERGDRLDDLIGKTDDLADSFQRTSTRVARKYWWKEHQDDDPHRRGVAKHATAALPAFPWKQAAFQKTVSEVFSRQKRRVNEASV